MYGGALLSLIVSWVLFPLVLAAVGAGWGVLAERLVGMRVGVLLVPLGLAAALVVASLLTAWSTIAPAAVPVVGVGAVVGLALGWRLAEGVARWPALAALGALLSVRGAGGAVGQRDVRGVRASGRHGDMARR